MGSNDPNGIHENLLFNQHDVEQEFLPSLSERIRNEFPRIDRVHDLAVREFRERFAKTGRPVILSGLTDDWNNRNIFSLDYFAEKCGDARVLLNPYDAELMEQTDIRTIVNKIKQSDPENPVYLQEWWFQKDCEAFLDDLGGSIEHFADDWGNKVLGFVNRTLWIGSKGAKTPIHVDAIPFNISSVQLFGRKEWFLFGRNACLHKKQNGSLDYERFLNDPATQTMSGTLEQGEVLFVPYDWWHRTETLEHSASVNSMYITEQIIQPYLRGLFTMPLLMALRQDELKELSPLRYNIALDRLKTLAHLIEFDSEYAMHAITSP
jgi:hypothetical protein